MLPAILAALPWAAPFFGMPRLASTSPNLTDVAPEDGVPVSVIIPARNESAQIETVVRSVLASTYRPLEVLVVDDRSTDDTAARVEAMACEDGRLRLVRGEPLPSGWYGKPWACRQGARAATGEILVFTDADTTHDPALLGHAVAMLHRERADLLTLSPKQVVVSFWERLVMPQIWIILGLRYHPSRVNDRTDPRDVIANGQFLMFPRASYDAMGTHDLVKGEVVEDLALAQHIVRQGRRLRFVFAQTLMETRMYQNLGQLVEGWSKNLYLGSRLTFPGRPLLQAVAPFTIMAALLFWLLPPLGVLAAATGAAPALLGWASLATSFAFCFWALISFGMGAPMWYGLLYPLGAGATLYILLRSMLRGARKVEWRGRVYDEVTSSVQEPGAVPGPRAASGEALRT
ncbi:MAG TPA: glycosyltransferase family 2 protein [Gemmatimonadales bacterium]|nr:glycosyltransferase family 2 protein [Gemmatimonadales bacterium]